MLYEYVLENGTWKLYWGGRIGQDANTPRCQQREVGPPVLVVQAEAAVASRREEPALTLQA